MITMLLKLQARARLAQTPYSLNNAALGHALRGYREMAGVARVEAARFIGIEILRLRHLEAGLSKWTPCVMYMFLDVCDNANR